MLGLWKTFWKLKKTTCTGNFGVAQFVKDILDPEENEDTPEKMICTRNSRLTNFVENVLNVEEI